MCGSGVKIGIVVIILALKQTHQGHIQALVEYYAVEVFILSQEFAECRYDMVQNLAISLTETVFAYVCLHNNHLCFNANRYYYN